MYKRIRYGGIKGKPSNYSEFIIDTEEDLSLIPIENNECSIGSLAYSDKKVFILYPGGWSVIDYSIKNIADKYYQNLLTKYVLRDFDEELIIDSETIGHYAGVLSKRIIAENATSAIDYAFYNCKAEYIDLPNITTVSEYIFQSCSNLKSVNLPNVTSIGNSAFYNCGSLTDISLPNVTSISSYAFQKCGSLTDISLPNVTIIGSQAFRYCSSLTNINLPNATNIDSFAFRDCNSLTKVILPSVNSIRYGAFDNCGSLSEVSLPNVTSIDFFAFSGCNNLLDIYLPNAQSSYSNAPWGATNATIHYECEFNEDGIPLEIIEGE